MKHLAYPDLVWANAGRPQITKAEIARDAVGGGVAYWRVPQGSGFARHSHKGYEYILLVKGKMNFSGVILNEGDFLITIQDEEHEAMALQDSVIVVVNERTNS